MSETCMVESAADMCRLLRDACPDRAAEFALAQHERACSCHDDHLTAYWLEVTTLLGSTHHSSIPLPFAA